MEYLIKYSATKKVISLITRLKSTIRNHKCHNFRKMSDYSRIFEKQQWKISFCDTIVYIRHDVKCCKISQAMTSLHKMPAQIQNKFTEIFLIMLSTKILQNGDKS